MSGQITMKDLEGTVSRINRITKSPETNYTMSGKSYRANVGNYHLSGAYGGYALHRMVNDGGGVKDIFGGHMPKRELYYRMQSFIKGLEARS